MDLRIIEAFQAIRNPVLDWFFYISTNLGDQYAFILVAAILYWTFDKKFAHKFALTFLVSAFINTGLKNLIQRPRPYTIEGIEPPFGYETTGYSFPSGHAQASGVLGYTAYELDQKTHLSWIKWLGLFIVIVVPLSRVYLAQHYLSDVLVGLVISILVAIAMFKLIDLMNDNEEIYTLFLVPILLLVVIFIPNHDVYIAAGGFIGFAIGYFIEKRYVKFNVIDKTINQVLKVIIGIIIALAIKEGLKLIFPDVLIFDFIRYFLIGGWAALGAPYMFKYVFKKIYKKKFNELTNQELYDILDLRYTVFMMEQEIIYVDTDYKDQKCMHYYIKDEKDKIVSYLRVLPKGLKYEEYAVGRVVTDQKYRKQGLATILMETVKKDLKGEAIRISGQAYLQAYYEKLGFKTVKGPYIEEGILHYEMLCDNK